MTRHHRVELALVALIVVAGAFYARHSYIPTYADRHVEISESKHRMDVGDPGEWFSAWSIGDGQAFAVIASDPLGADEGTTLGEPAYRYGRAGYGWLVWAASLGRAHWVPYAMAVVGGLAVIGTLALAARLRPRLGPAAWLVVVNPAVFIGFAGDTAEALGILALGLAMATGKWWPAAALGVIRPSYVVALFARWRLLLAGVAAAVGLGLVWMARFGVDLSQYGGRLGLPFQGYWKEPSVQAAALAALALVTVATGWRHRDWAWVATGVFVLCFTGEVVASGLNGWRAGGALFVLWAFGPGADRRAQFGASAADVGWSRSGDTKLVRSAPYSLQRLRRVGG